MPSQDISFFRGDDARCRRYESYLSKVNPQYLKAGQKGTGVPLMITFCILVEKVEIYQRRFGFAELF